jgi:hypothetical protein
VKTTDQRAGEAVARAVIARCHLAATPEGDAYANEGVELLDALDRDWPMIAEWNKRACAYVHAIEVAKRAAAKKR